MKPFWVTFYSYKGGVGRSLALANIAALLVSKGRRVLLIDFDLEAPGLDSFSEFSAASEREGVVEYVSEFARTKVAPTIQRFVHQCHLPDHKRGKLWLMPAGKKDAAYNKQLNRINWSELYESGLGSPFFMNWKATINKEYAPDFVFVDSRTGLTEIGGVCTTQFPDLVVMLFGLNEQNVKGTATVAQSVREATQEELSQIHFVASPVPNLPSDQRSARSPNSPETRSLISERMAAAYEKLGTKKISTLRYFAPAALSEKLFVWDDDAFRQSLMIDYESLKDEVVSFNRTGLDFLLDQAEEALNVNDLKRTERIVSVLDRDFADRAEALMVKSRYALLSGREPEAVELAESAFDLDVTYSGPTGFLQNQYQRTGQWEKLVELHDRLLAARSRFSSGRLPRLLEDRARTMMMLCRYDEAESSYREVWAHEQKSQMSPATALISLFNIAESHRRASRVIHTDEWEKVAELFSQSGTASDQPLNIQANQWQAMHIAFACIGNLSAASDALKKARRVAEAAGEIEEMFSVEYYRHVALAEFISSNEKMIQALDRRQLWDGMSLVSRAEDVRS